MKLKSRIKHQPKTSFTLIELLVAELNYLRVAAIMLPQGDLRDSVPHQLTDRLQETIPGKIRISRITLTTLPQENTSSSLKESVPIR